MQTQRVESTLCFWLSVLCFVGSGCGRSSPGQKVEDTLKQTAQKEGKVQVLEARVVNVSGKQQLNIFISVAERSSPDFAGKMEYLWKLAYQTEQEKSAGISQVNVLFAQPATLDVLETWSAQMEQVKSFAQGQITYEQLLQTVTRQGSGLAP